VSRSFANERVLITGGSSGIGRALARALARAGAHVCIVARGQARLDATVEELRELAASPEQVLFGHALDVAEPEQVRAAVEPVLARLGGLDVLVNNAGIAHPAAVLDTPDEVFDAMMRVNYFGTVHVTRAFLPAMIEAGGGQIAIVASLAAVVGIYGYTAYASSKFALRGFAECLRQDLIAHGIDVSLVLPPDTDTPQLAQENRIKPAETKAIAGTVKPLSAEVVAAAILTGLRRRRFVVIPGLASKLVYFAAGRWPWLTRWVIDRDLRRFQRQRARALAEGDSG
jgi:3-dehydrosphinganine reductase